MAPSWVAICLILCVSARMTSAQDVKTYKVGDSAGWTYINASSGLPADYKTWAAQYQFFVNDIIRFAYEPMKQNVYLFNSSESWTSCDLTVGKMLDDGTAGFSEWYLPVEGYYNFASGINCDKGMKFRIFAVKSAGTGPVDAPIPAPSPSKSAPGPSKLAPAPSMSPATSPGPSVAVAPSLLSMTGSRGPSKAPAPPPTASRSAPAVWTQTLLLATTGAAAAAAFLLRL
ncbi:hypothetical protein Mapa_008459 [Marchantia paleacea]|nr:hypothetical protein Mapa_008459 [Marchantia paleacea]